MCAIVGTQYSHISVDRERQKHCIQLYILNSLRMLGGDEAHPRFVIRTIYAIMDIPTG